MNRNQIVSRWAWPMAGLLSWIGGISVWAGLAASFSGAACPFCSAVSQTLRQEMGQMQAVAVATMVPGSATESDAEFEILTVIDGDQLVSPKQRLRVNYFGKAKPDQKFLLMGVDPPELLWSSPLPISERAAEYVRDVEQLPKDPVEQLKFYLDYLEHPDSLLAQDAYDEFASAPYETIQKLEPELDREQLLDWVQDSSLPPDRKRLYLVMLGVCGKPEDAELLESMLRSENADQRGGLDSMIACYITLKGPEGLELVDELFLANKQSQYADTYAAIMALRFHGTEGDVVPKKRILESMRLILDRPELADLVIPDLARWEDWSQIEKLAELFRESDDDNSWVRVPVINYMRACPKPQAEKTLEELKELDPAAYKRATSFFPVPQSSGDSSDTSSLRTSESIGTLAVDSLPPRMTAGEQLAWARLDSGSGAVPAKPAGTNAGQATTGASVAKNASLNAADKPISGPRLAASYVDGSYLAAMSVNQAFVVSVLGMVSVTLWLSMWLVISGAGSHGTLANLLVWLAR